MKFSIRKPQFFVDVGFERWFDYIEITILRNYDLFLEMKRKLNSPETEPFCICGRGFLRYCLYHALNNNVERGMDVERKIKNKNERMGRSDKNKFS